jgi:hypothetical protein
VWLPEIIRSIAEASEVTRPWRTLNISQSSSKGSRNRMRHDCRPESVIANHEPITIA